MQTTIQNIECAVSAIGAYQPCTINEIAREIKEQGNGVPFSEAVHALSFLMEHGLIEIDEDSPSFNETQIWLAFDLFDVNSHLDEIFGTLGVV